MNELETYLSYILKQMQEERRKANIEPSAVLLVEVLNRATNDVKRVLWTMCQDDEVIMHKTLNSFSFELK